MVPQSKGKIFLADERGCNELEWFRSYNTFNFGRYHNEHKTPFGALCVLNEDTLAEGCSMAMKVEDDTHIILVPVVGAVSWKTNHNAEGIVEAGQAQVLPLCAGSTVTITNPYEDALVKYLQLWIKTPGDAPEKAHRLFSFSIDDNKNTLTAAFTHPASDFRPPNSELQTLNSELQTPNSRLFKGFLGKFDGREEAVYKTTDPQNGLFAFVLQGAFEVQHRLLHTGDGLGLWELPEIEMEALSNDAIILVIELPLQ